MSARRRARRWEHRFRVGDRRAVLRVVGVVLGAFGFGYLVTWLFFFSGAAPSEVVTVPDLRELAVDEARERLERIDLELEIGDSLANPRLPERAVVAQSPLPGEEASRGVSVRVILSTGRPRRVVPDVDSLPADLALRALEAAGFQVEVSEAPAIVPAGSVAEVQPAPGTEVRLPASVRMIVSAGAPRVEVPSLLGLPEVEARAALEGVGLLLGDVEYGFIRLEDEEEVVVEQEPPAGDSIDGGSVVRVRVGPARILNRSSFVPGVER